jgi:hypothetical protein
MLKLVLFIHLASKHIIFKLYAEVKILCSHIVLLKLDHSDVNAKLRINLSPQNFGN